MLERRINAIDVACKVTLNPDDRWVIADAQITLSTRRVQELVELARKGLEKMKEERA